MRLSISKSLFTFIIFTSILGCKDDTPCIPEVLSADMRIFRSNERCGDLGLPWEVSFGAKFYFDYQFNCDKTCSNKRIVFEDANMYVKHASGVIDTAFTLSISGGFCRNSKDSLPNSFPFIILENEVGVSDYIVYEMGDTIVFELKEPNLIFTDEEGRYTKTSERIPLDLPDYTKEYIVQPADFDCD